jgi:beta-glucosidase/6-phospho-beta-glucosidase/beta-galactosidase
MRCTAAPADIPEDPYIESTGYWQDISVDQSDDDVWKTTDMGWGVYPEGMRKMLNYIQKEFNPRGGIIITGGVLLLLGLC